MPSGPPANLDGSPRRKLCQRTPTKVGQPRAMCGTHRGSINSSIRLAKPHVILSSKKFRYRTAFATREPRSDAGAKNALAFPPLAGQPRAYRHNRRCLSPALELSRCAVSQAGLRGLSLSLFIAESGLGGARLVVPSAARRDLAAFASCSVGVHLPRHHRHRPGAPAARAVAVVYAASLIGLFGWWFSLRPSADRDWAAECLPTCLGHVERRPADRPQRP